MTTKTEEQIRQEIDSIDWDAISDENRLRDIGKELYHYARSYEELGYENTVAVVASVMDGFQVNVPKHMRRDDGQHIAAGFARALMLNAAATLEPEEERV
ncbi:MAG: hypothetical protein WD274_13155 [Acidimicrobiia bacterium]